VFVCLGLEGLGAGQARGGSGGHGSANQTQNRAEPVRGATSERCDQAAAADAPRRHYLHAARGHARRAQELLTQDGAHDQERHAGNLKLNEIHK
jgi:hypothetical protein